MAKRRSIQNSIRYLQDSSSDDDSVQVINQPVSSVALGIAPTQAVAEQWSFEELNKVKNVSPPRAPKEIMPRTPKPIGPFTEKERKSGKAEISIGHLSRFMRRTKKTHDEYATEILQLRYENEALKAQNRQYRTKMRKIQRLSHAAIERNDYIQEGANASGEVTMNGEMKSDSEDDDPWNGIVYHSTNELPVD